MPHTTYCLDGLGMSRRPGHVRSMDVIMLASTRFMLTCQGNMVCREQPGRSTAARACVATSSSSAHMDMDDIMDTRCRRPSHPHGSAPDGQEGKSPKIPLSPPRSHAGARNQDRRIAFSGRPRISHRSFGIALLPGTKKTCMYPCSCTARIAHETRTGFFYYY